MYTRGGGAMPCNIYPADMPHVVLPNEDCEEFYSSAAQLIRAGATSAVFKFFAATVDGVGRQLRSCHFNFAVLPAECRGWEVTLPHCWRSRIICCGVEEAY